MFLFFSRKLAFALLSVSFVAAQIDNNVEAAGCKAFNLLGREIDLPMTNGLYLWNNNYSATKYCRDLYGTEAIPLNTKPDYVCNQYHYSTVEFRSGFGVWSDAHWAIGDTQGPKFCFWRILSLECCYPELVDIRDVDGPNGGGPNLGVVPLGPPPTPSPTRDWSNFYYFAGHSLYSLRGSDNDNV